MQRYRFQTLKQASKDHMRKLAQKNEDEAEYKAMIDNLEAKTDFFKRLSEVKGDDHPYIKSVKAKINSILDQELEYLQF